MDNPTAPIPSADSRPAVSSPVETPPESRNPRLLFWLLGGFAVLILGIGVGAFGAKFLNQSQLVSTSSPTPQIQSPTPTSNTTASWKTYSSTRYRLSFKYPAKGTVAEPVVNDTSIYVEIPELESSLLVISQVDLKGKTPEEYLIDKNKITLSPLK